MQILRLLTLARTDSRDDLQELSIYGRLRKVSNCGPVSMFRSLLVTWKGQYPPHVIAKRVKDFFRSAFKLVHYLLCCAVLCYAVLHCETVKH